MFKSAENTNLTQTNIGNLQKRIEGTVIAPKHPAYEEARQVWNGMIDRYPALIVEVETAEDVAACIRFARQHDLVLSVRGGGHNVAGFATNDGGIVVDLKRLNKVVVDPAVKAVQAGGGVTIGELDAATQQYGLAVPMGVVSATGIAGLTLSGGAGWMRNKHGLSCDNLIGAEMVTADGLIIQVSETVNRDLLWGLRGGGGNFGIVTRFDFRAYPLGPQVYVNAIFYDGARLQEALHFFREQVSQLPEEVSLLAALGKFPPADAFPADLHGKPFALFIGVYIGDAEEGKAVAQSLYKFGEPLLDFSGIMTWQEVQQFFDEDYPDGARYYWKSQNISGLSDAAIEVIADGFARMPPGESTIDIWHMGGQASRFSPDYAAYAARDVEYIFNVEANWHDPAYDDANVNWVRDYLEAIRPFAKGGRYLNFPGFNEEADMMKHAFGAQYKRLVALKQKWDPTNLFRMNTNIAVDGER